MKILVTGGPVHAKLDAVKIITNTFKGGLMAELADKLKVADINNVEITYLTAKGSKLPCTNNPTILFHDGFHDYMQQVIALAPQFDAVVLGAAVANLIPLTPWVGKFPSHNYKVGDRIPIDFTIAPRVIDEVKKVAPKTHLFGFKLLSGVSFDELINAAYGVLLESKATAVFANDRKQLLTKYAVTKERGVHEMSLEKMAQFIIECVKDEYYRTVYSEKIATMDLDAFSKFCALKKQFADSFKRTPEGYIFGTVAVRLPNGDGFITTGRGKKELDDWGVVREVIHRERLVVTYGEKKLTLNAPLLDFIFRANKNVRAIVHTHCHDLWQDELPYAPPGTVRDSTRNVHRSFYIKNHGAFYLIDWEGNTIL